MYLYELIFTRSFAHFLSKIFLLYSIKTIVSAFNELSRDLTPERENYQKKRNLIVRKITHKEKNNIYLHQTQKKNINKLYIK